MKSPHTNFFRLSALVVSVICSFAEPSYADSVTLECSGTTATKIFTPGNERDVSNDYSGTFHIDLSAQTVNDQPASVSTDSVDWVSKAINEACGINRNTLELFCGGSHDSDDGMMSKGWKTNAHCQKAQRQF